MKIAIITPDEIEERDMTADEISAKETLDATDKAANDAAKANEQAKEDTKARAKTKLIAGEALTEEEANVLVGV